MDTDFQALARFAGELCELMRTQASEAAAPLLGCVLCAVHCRAPGQCACTDDDRATYAALIDLAGKSRANRRGSGERALALLEKLQVDAIALKLAAWSLEVEATLDLLAAHIGTAADWNTPVSEALMLPRPQELGLAEAYERTRFPGNQHFFCIFAMCKSEGVNAEMAREQASVLRGGFLNPRNLPASGYYRAPNAHTLDALPGERFYTGMPLTHALKIRTAIGTNESVAPVTVAIPFPHGTRICHGSPAPTSTMELWLENRPFAQRLRMARLLAEVLAKLITRGVQVRLTSAASVFVIEEGESARPLLLECTLAFPGELGDKCALQLSGVVASLIAKQAGPGVAPTAGASEEAARAICASNGAGKLGADALAAALRCAECARTCTVCFCHVSGPTVPRPPLGMECTTGHYTCADCLNDCIASSTPTNVIQLGGMNSFAFKCPTCVHPLLVQEFYTCLLRARLRDGFHRNRHRHGHPWDAHGRGGPRAGRPLRERARTGARRALPHVQGRVSRVRRLHDAVLHRSRMPLLLRVLHGSHWQR